MPDPHPDFSILLWALGAFVATLAMHLGLGWVRTAQRGSAVLAEWRALLLAAAAIGAGLTSASVLCLQAQPMLFPLGFGWLASAALCVAALAVCLPGVALAMMSERSAFATASIFASAGLLALAMMGLYAGWLWAADFRPGVLWRPELLGAAAVWSMGGLAVAQWIALAPAFQTGPRRALWRIAAAAVAALTMMLGLQLMSMAAGLQVQTLSGNKDQLPGTVLSLVCGVLDHWRWWR